jgi:predicted phage tail protein
MNMLFLICGSLLVSSMEIKQPKSRSLAAFRARIRRLTHNETIDPNVDKVLVEKFATRNNC